jgi:arginine-tRNA-protein transferase
MRTREKIIQDELEPCPYIEGAWARLPMRWQLRQVPGERFDALLALGDRRVGRMLYRTTCPDCTACEPIRVPVAGFVPTRAQRRILNKNKDITVEAGPATYSEEKLALYQRHKSERGLDRSEVPMNRAGYEGWFVQSCTDTIEMIYRVQGRMIGVGIVDLGKQDASSVYFFFDPDEHRRSLGVFSVLMEIAWLRANGGRHLYLGLYVEDCRHLVYKAGYAPHERLRGGAWLPTAEARPPTAAADDGDEADDAADGPG